MAPLSQLRGARILITGHTGFTGGWAALKLAHLGAEIHGFALAPDTKPAFFDLADLWPLFKSHTLGDLADYALLSQTISEIAPDAILHLAAQPLVYAGYAHPVRTFMTNAQGTAHLLEAARLTQSVRGVVAITTDKVYAPDPDALPFKETARLGGKDPYSASKAAAELIIDGYRHSLSAWNRTMPIEVARGGNIFGGGDFSSHRIVPDFYRAVQNRTALRLRNPDARRPWQHVLDLVNGYCLLLERVLEGDRTNPGEAWNFGPDPEAAIPVIDLIGKFQKAWEPVTLDKMQGLPETAALSISSTKARIELGWRPTLSLDDAIDLTVDWYRTALSAPENLAALSRAQIENHSDAR